MPSNEVKGICTGYTGYQICSSILPGIENFCWLFIRLTKLFDMNPQTLKSTGY